MALDEPIDLLNVAFEQPTSNQMNVFRVPDRISGEEALQELMLLSPHRQWNFTNVRFSRYCHNIL